VEGVEDKLLKLSSVCILIEIPEKFVNNMTLRRVRMAQFTTSNRILKSLAGNFSPALVEFYVFKYNNKSYISVRLNARFVGYVNLKKKKR